MAIENTIKRMLSAAGLVGVLAGSACGEDKDKESCTKDTDCREPRICDSDLGYCVDSNGGSSGSSSGSSSNPCGNSPVYGKHLWEIAYCRYGLIMNKDCSVTHVTKEDNPQLDVTYSGLILIIPDDYSDNSKYVLDPSLRFTDSPYQASNWEEVNQKLDMYGGYVLLTVNPPPGEVPTEIDRCVPEYISSCVLVPLNILYSYEECKNSKYYVGVEYPNDPDK